MENPSKVLIKKEKKRKSHIRERYNNAYDASSYKLAERLSTRLEEMGKDLVDMISEINDASSALSKHNKADDPVYLLRYVINRLLLIFLFLVISSC